MPGQLALIGTPIGNLGDITRRAVETLRGLDILYCEDTRVTAKLLSHLSLTIPTRALSDDAPADRWRRAVREAQQGMRVGFVTDAGMPGVSDPGRRLVREAWAAGITPTVVPGPSSVGTLLAACPFVNNTFRFAGFPPRKLGERDAFIRRIVESEEPSFLFESPQRAHAFLDELCPALEAERQVLIGREMTKLYEQLVLITAGEWAPTSPRVLAIGEFTIAVAARAVAADARPVEEIDAALSRLTDGGFSKRDAVKALAAVWEVHPNQIKRIAYGAD